MALDIRTLSIVVAVANILQTLAIGFLYIKNKKYPGILWWALGSAITAIGFLLYLVRDFSQSALISIILPNALTVAGILFIYIGIMHFLEREENQGLVFSVFAVFIALYFYFTYVTDDINARTVIVSVALIFYLLLIVQALLGKIPTAITDSSHFIAVILFSEACFFVFRTYSVLTFAPVETLFTPTLIQTLVFVVYFVAGILLTFGLIFMVTQRLHAEVTDAKDHFEILFNTNPEGIAIHEIVYSTSGEPLEYRILDVNPAFEHILGLKREDVIGKTSKEVYRVDTPPYFQLYSRVAETGQAEEFESFFAPMEKHFHILTYSPEHGKFATIFEDITKRKRAEESLRESEAMLRTVLDTMPSGVTVRDVRTGEIVLSNPRSKEIMGALVGNIVGIGKYCGKYPDGRSYRIEDWPMARSMATGEEVNNEEIQCERSDGSRIILNLSSAPIRDQYGKIIMGVGIFHDITERKQAEEVLQNNIRLLENVMDSSPSPIFLKDLEGKFISINSALERMLGKSRQDLKGKTDYDIAPKELADYWRSHDKTVIETGTAIQIEEVADLPDRQYIFLANKFPLVDIHGHIYGIGAISHDITERKKAENEVIRKNTELNAINEELTASEEELHQNIEELALREQELQGALAEKEVLLSEIHHRVKNNLTAFISLLSLDGSYEDTESGRALRKDLQNRARSMALIHETLYRTGKFSKVDMGMYLKNLVDQIATSYGVREDIHVVVEVHDVTLSIDRATTAGLIINELVTNSLKYAFPPGFDCTAVRGEPCTIRVTLTHKDGIDVLIVTDNGCGLPEGFDPLKSKSFGLKLVNFLTRHQLMADISIQRDKGTAFIFHLKNTEDTT